MSTHIERNSRKILQRLEGDGWKVVSIVGSHHKLKNPRFASSIVLPHPQKDLPIGTAKQIHKLAGW